MKTLNGLPWVGLVLIFLRACSVTQSCPTSWRPYGWTVAWQAPLSMGFSRQGYWFSSIQFSRIWLFATPWTAAPQAFPVHHQLPEPTQTHVHWVSNAIQPSHPWSSPSPPSLNLSQHQGLFKWVRFSHEVAKVLEFQLQHQSFQWTPRTDIL